MKIAFVYFKDIYCGELKELDDHYEFKYSSDYLNNKDAKPISLSLPLTNKTYSSVILFPFFDGLIPEGYLLDILLSKFKLDVTDRFELLLKSGLDTIGAVTIKENSNE